MNGNLAYLSGVSSISSSTLASLGSAESMYVGGGMEPVLSSSPFFLNNSSHYGSRSAGSAVHRRFDFFALFLFICEVRLTLVWFVFVCIFSGLRCCNRSPTECNGTV